MYHTRTPSLGEKIQHGCLMYLCSEHPSCFSCLINLGWTSPKLGRQHKIFDQAIKEVLNFTLFPNIMEFEVGTWSIFLIRQLRDMSEFGMWKSVSNQPAYYMEWSGPHWCLTNQHGCSSTWNGSQTPGVSAVLTKHCYFDVDVMMPNWHHRSTYFMKRKSSWISYL